MSKKFAVITSINPKTPALEILAKNSNVSIVVVGDRKSSLIESKDNIIFLSLEDQKKLGFKFAKYCPENHYCRKNIGYLFAMKNGADVIYDTDDDNYLLSKLKIPDFMCSQLISSNKKFVNVYKYFTDRTIWPRGFPLDYVRKNKVFIKKSNKTEIGVWQGLVNEDPDVDAIYRLLINDKITFNESSPVCLKRGSYCPFNSQNTYWNKSAFALTYLPCTVSFRFTDILRGYVAQKLLWISGKTVGFMSPTTMQKRNEHNLMLDFKQEVEMYLNTKRIVETIDKFEAKSGDLGKNIYHIYKNLSRRGFIKNTEIELLRLWLKDFDNTN